MPEDPSKRPSTTEPAAAGEASAPSETPEETGLKPEEQPVVTGTVFLMLLFLMMIFGFWMLMYLTLLNR